MTSPASTIGQAAKNYNLTFRNCTFKRNVGAGSGSAWAGVNGVKAVYGVHDITFDGCTFEEFSRFSIEVWSDDDPANRPYNIAVVDSVFEPAGSQCISWSGGRNPLYSIVDGCLFKGYGTESTRAWGACLEFAGSHHIVTRNSDIWTGSGSAFNVNNVSSPATCTSRTCVSIPTRRTCTSRALPTCTRTSSAATG